MNDPTVSITVKVKEIADKKHEMIDNAIYGYLQQVVEENSIDIDLYMNREAILDALYTYSVHPVKHGKWVDTTKIRWVNKTNVPVVMCTECGIQFCDLINNHHYMYKYCPQCGAKMDKE
jgi:hypothetical protein